MCFLSQAAWASLIICAARSPMMMQGAIVLPVVTRGMIDGPRMAA